MILAAAAKFVLILQFWNVPGFPPLVVHDVPMTWEECTNSLRTIRNAVGEQGDFCMDADLAQQRVIVDAK